MTLISAHLVLFTLHGKVFFNENTVCWNKRRTGVKYAALNHPKGSTTHMCRFRLRGSDNSQPHFTKELFTDRYMCTQTHKAPAVGLFNVLQHIQCWRDISDYLKWGCTRYFSIVSVLATVVWRNRQEETQKECSAVAKPPSICCVWAVESEMFLFKW